MGQKYSIIYNDVVNVEHEVQIYDDDYSDTTIDILGRAYLDCSSTDDLLECIRGQGLRLELEADSDRTFSDLYSEEEMTFRVVYLRDSVQLFEGWINSEGFYEDMVKSNWIVSFDCVDGLSYLENRSFVETDGTRISGRITQLSALVKAFARTGLQKNIYTSINTFYTGLSTSVNVLANVYMATNRFVRDDEQTTMSCEEVIRGVLEPYGAVCKSYGDGWYIYKPNEIYNSALVTFWEYDYTGSAGAGFGLDLAATLGSHINRFYPHHINENQQLGIERSLGAYRIHYKYGEPESFLENEYLISDDGTTIDDWTIVSTTNMTTPFEIGEGSVTINFVTSGGIDQMEADYVTVTDDSQYTFELSFEADQGAGSGDVLIQVRMSDKVLPDGTATIYYLQDDMTWNTTPANLLAYEDLGYTGEIVWSFTPDSKPAGITGNGYLYLNIHTPISTVATGSVTFNRIRLYLASADLIEGGEYHTFQRTSNPSARADDVKEVFMGDNSFGLWGALYKSDSTTPTTAWARTIWSESKKLLHIMGDEYMRMYQSPARIYKGDIYGYVNYLDRFTIDGITGYFMILEYSYDTKANITSIVLKQIFGDELTGDVTYKLTQEQTTKVVKPTIKG